MNLCFQNSNRCFQGVVVTVTVSRYLPWEFRRCSLEIPTSSIRRNILRVKAQRFRSTRRSVFCLRSVTIEGLGDELTAFTRELTYRFCNPPVFYLLASKQGARNSCRIHRSGSSLSAGWFGDSERKTFWKYAFRGKAGLIICDYLQYFRARSFVGIGEIQRSKEN